MGEPKRVASANLWHMHHGRVTFIEDIFPGHMHSCLRNVIQIIGLYIIYKGLYVFFKCSSMKFLIKI